MTALDAVRPAIETFYTALNDEAEGASGREIDVLDVEGLAHMGAARAQQLRHTSLIAHAVEMG